MPFLQELIGLSTFPDVDVNQNCLFCTQLVLQADVHASDIDPTGKLDVNDVDVVAVEKCLPAKYVNSHNDICVKNDIRLSDAEMCKEGDISNGGLRVRRDCETRTKGVQRCSVIEEETGQVEREANSVEVSHTMGAGNIAGVSVDVDCVIKQESTKAEKDNIIKRESKPINKPATTDEIVQSQNGHKETVEEDLTHAKDNAISFHAHDTKNPSQKNVTSSIVHTAPFEEFPQYCNKSSLASFTDNNIEPGITEENEVDNQPISKSNTSLPVLCVANRMSPNIVQEMDSDQDTRSSRLSANISSSRWQQHDYSTPSGIPTKSILDLEPNLNGCQNDLEMTLKDFTSSRSLNYENTVL